MKPLPKGRVGAQIVFGRLEEVGREDVKKVVYTYKLLLGLYPRIEDTK